MTCVKTLEELGREVAQDQERSTLQPSMTLKTQSVSNHLEESLKYTGSLVMPVGGISFLQDSECHSGTTKKFSPPWSLLNTFLPSQT